LIPAGTGFDMYRDTFLKRLSRSGGDEGDEEGVEPEGELPEGG
jgi:hypothetical protein